MKESGHAGNRLMGGRRSKINSVEKRIKVYIRANGLMSVGWPHEHQLAGT